MNRLNKVERLFLVRILKYVFYLTLVISTESVCRDNQTEEWFILLYKYTIHPFHKSLRWTKKKLKRKCYKLQVKAIMILSPVEKHNEKNVFFVFFSVFSSPFVTFQTLEIFTKFKANFCFVNFRKQTIFLVFFSKGASINRVLLIEKMRQ